MNALTTKRRAVYLGLVLALAACGAERGGTDGGEEASSPARPVPSETEPAGRAGYTVVEVASGATIRGTVRFLGAVPPPRTMAVTEDAEACGASQQMQTLEVGSGQGLANAVASLVDITQGAALEAAASPPALDQRGCRFAPHVLIVPAGRTVGILNSDPITHNIHTVTFENRPLNRAQPQGLRTIEVTFPRAEKVKVRCDIHPWMGAWIVVVDHPYHAVTGGDGGFVIENVPEGTYTLEIWHETLGSSTQTVTVAAGDVTDVSVEVGAEE